MEKLERAKETDVFRKRSSIEIRHSAKESIKEEDPSEKDDYDDDFESMSMTGSAIRSRISSRVQNRKEEESGEEVVERSKRWTSRCRTSQPKAKKQKNQKQPSSSANICSPFGKQNFTQSTNE